MLVCSVSQRPQRHVIAANIVEVANALDSTGLGVIFATLTDNPGNAIDRIDAFNGQRIVEAANAADVLNASVPAVYPVSLIETASAAATPDATKAVAGAIWDAATLASVTLSGGSLVATNTGTTSTNQGAHVAFASGKTTGKYYFECTLTTFTNGAGVGIGIGNTASTYAGLSASYTGGNMNLAVGHTGTGVITAAGGNSGFSLGALVSGNTVCVAVDLVNARVWFRKGASGLWNNTGGHDPTIGNGSAGGFGTPSGTVVPFVTFGSGLAGAAGQAGNVITANFGGSSFVGAVPSGYTAGWI